MSIHKSLKIRNALVRQRNVLRRDERLAKMATLGTRRDGDSVFGLPKTKVAKIKKPAKAKKVVAEGEVAAATDGAPAAEPAAEPRAAGKSAGKAAGKPAGKPGK